MVDTANGVESMGDGPPVEATVPATHDADGRPTRLLSGSQLIRISLYWLGISAVWSGILDIVNGRIQFAGLAAKGSEGLGALQIALVGTVIAIAVQPTVGSISDYTMTRWGRRKPYIFIGATLDVVFLYGIATANGLFAIGAFVTLLQFSSNFAQGPFQGYVPDLVPALLGTRQSLRVRGRGAGGATKRKRPQRVLLRNDGHRSHRVRRDDGRLHRSP